jgi:radical SAM superfamily enzyme YgiQ (UPF0313 family)
MGPRFTRDAKAVDAQIHGIFILGLPGETHETIRVTIPFVPDVDPRAIRVSFAAPYPGSALQLQARETGGLTGDGLVHDHGT